jgi:hypothetical protein
VKGKNIYVLNVWTGQSVRNILKDEQYTGTIFAGRTYQDSNGRKYHTPRSEWFVFPDKHAAIISKEVFEAVQELRSKTRKNMSRRNYLLTGKISCGCCGFAMVYGESTIPATYRCMKTHANPMADCHKMKVNANELEKAVMTIIKKQAEVVLDNGDLSELRKMTDFDKRTAECEKQIRQWVEQRQTYYEQFVQGEIDRETHVKLKGECTANIDRLNNQLAVVKQIERDKEADKKVTAIAKEALSTTAAPQDIVNALVEKILLFPGNRVEIRWKFVNFAVGV